MNRSVGNKNKKTNRKKGVPELSPGIPAKMLQYLMLIMLLVLVFIVSAYAGRVKKAENARKNAGREENTDSAESAQAESASGTESEGAGREMEPGTKGTIVLDAGHGGFDPGVLGASGIAERELNLIFAKKLEALLVEEGYRVVQTRPTEAGLYDEGQTHKKAQDMQRRCAVIEAQHPLVTVSIHQNSYPDGSVSGPQVFYFGQSKEGERLASCIQSCMNEQLEVKNPKSHKGNNSYYMLKRSEGTAVIVECGFLTNPEEEAKLCDEAYQDRAVRAICDGVLQYLADSEPDSSASGS